jgi:hypothetical protein
LDRNPFPIKIVSVMKKEYEGGGQEPEMVNRPDVVDVF